MCELDESIGTFSLVFNREKGCIRFPPECLDSDCDIELNAIRQQGPFQSVIKINMLGKDVKKIESTKGKSFSERNVQMIFDLTTVDHDFKLQFNCHIDEKKVISILYNTYLLSIWQCIYN